MVAAGEAVKLTLEKLGIPDLPPNLCISGVSSLYRKCLNQEGAGSVGSRNHRVVTAHSRGS